MHMWVHMCVHMCVCVFQNVYGWVGLCCKSSINHFRFRHSYIYIERLVARRGGRIGRAQASLVGDQEFASQSGETNDLQN